MLPRTFAIISLFFSFPIVVVPQAVPEDKNLVVNGDFEEYEGKLKRLNSIEMALGWSGATNYKPDLYSGLVAEPLVSVPKNAYGKQNALSGKNYAGIRAWSFGNKEARQYLQTKLNGLLKKGQRYCVRYYVSLADLSKYSSNELGAYFTTSLLAKHDERTLSYPVEVPRLRSKLYDDPYGWQGVCGVYEAKGGEFYLVIGNFALNEKTETGRPVKPKEEERAQLPMAYYYIDDVAVFPVEKDSECTCTATDNAESDLIYGRSGISSPGMKPSEKIDLQVFYFKRFNSAVPPSMRPWIKEMAELMTQEQNIMVRLVGHIDKTEQDRARLRPEMAKLGDERAAAVKEALVSEGIDAARISVASAGADSPVDETGTDIGQSKNRRVEVELVK